MKVTQSCPTLCDPMDCIVHGILQARILEWVLFPFSRGSSEPRDWAQVSRVAGRFFTNWAIREAHWQVTQSKSKYAMAPYKIKKQGFLLRSCWRWERVGLYNWARVSVDGSIRNADTRCTAQRSEETRGHQNSFFISKFFLCHHKIWILFHIYETEL